MKNKKIALVYEIFSDDVNVINNYIDKFKENGIKLDSVYLYCKQFVDEKLIFFENIKMMKDSKIKKAKFEVFNLLDDFDVVIYSNSNYLFKVDINDVLDYSVYLLKNDEVSFLDKYLKKKFKSYSLFERSFRFDYFIVTRKMTNYKEIYHWITNNSFLYSSYFYDRIDGILNLMLQKYDLSIYYIEKNHNDFVENKKLILDKKKYPLISVLMSIYNRCDYLDDAINSVLNQSYSNFEFIIVVEFSENQKEILRKIEKYDDSRIKVIVNSKKLGFAKSLNLGLKKAKGKYLARMDDDDISDLSRFEKQINFLEQNHEIDVLGSYMQLFGISDEICKLPFESEILKIKCLYKIPVFHPTVMIRLTSLKKYNLLYHDVYAEDYDLWSRAIKYLRFANLPDVLYYYRYRKDNHSVSNEFAMNSSHNSIMAYQLKEYLNLVLSFDELQLLSGRIDVLGYCNNLDLVYQKKINLWNKIRKANRKSMFYKDSVVLAEIEEITEYYDSLKKMREKNRV